MGKSLIIPGADFSANKVSGLTTIYVDELDQLIAKGLSIITAPSQYAGYTPNFNFVGKPINAIQSKWKGSAGTIALCIGDSIKDTNYEVVRTITITAEDINTTNIKTFEPYALPEGKVLFIAQTDEVALCGYAQATGATSSFGHFKMQCGHSNASTNSSDSSLAINWMFIS